MRTQLMADCRHVLLEFAGSLLIFGYLAFKRNDKSHEITFSYRAHHVRKRRSYSSSTGGPWSVLFFGTNGFSLESLRSLYNEYKIKKLCRLEIVSVCEGKKNAVVQYAEEKGIIVNKWPLENNPQGFHIGIVVSFGHLIPSNIINSFPFGMLNAHPSLLPRWRGAAPITYPLIKGDTQTGVTVMKIMPKKFDIGEIIAQEELDIHADETLPELYIKLAKLSASALIDVIEKLPQVLSSSRPQEKLGITYAPKITSKTSLVKWDEMTAKNVYDLHRGLLGLYPLKTRFDGITIKLLDVRQTSKPKDVRNAENDVPGFARFDRNSNALVVTCKGPSWISVTKITVAGHSPMSALDFRNGFVRGRMKDWILFQNNVT